MPTHVVYQGKHYELPVDGLTPEDALLRIRNLLGETGDGTVLRRLQPGQSTENKPPGPMPQVGTVDGNDWGTMGRIGLATGEAGLALTAPGVGKLGRLALRAVPRVFGAASGAREGARVSRRLGVGDLPGAVVGGATGLAFPAPVSAASGAIEGGELAGPGGAMVGAALGAVGGGAGSGPLAKRVIGRIGRLALEAPAAEAAAESATVAKTVEAAKTAASVADDAATMATKKPKTILEALSASRSTPEAMSGLTPAEKEVAIEAAKIRGAREAEKQALEAAGMPPRKGVPSSMEKEEALFQRHGAGYGTPTAGGGYSQPISAETATVAAPAASAAPKFEGFIAAGQRLARDIPGVKAGQKVWLLVRDGKPFQAVGTSQEAQAAVAEARAAGQEITSTWTKVFGSGQ